MIVGILTIDVALFEAQTLKDKRSVTHGFKQRLRNSFNVSVAEVDYGDSPKRCRMGIAMISKEARPLHSQLDKIVEMVRHTRGMTLLEYERDVF